MGLARARRIARRAHRGGLYVGGGTLVAHLERVARSVAGSGGTAAAVETAWLSAIPSTGVDVRDLAMRGVPARVARAVDALQQRPDEPVAAFTARLRHDRTAALVRYAVLGDLHAHLAGRHAYEWFRPQHDALAATLELPPPPPAADPADLNLPALLAAYERQADGPDRTRIRAAIHAIARDPGAVPPEQLADLSRRWWMSADPWEEGVAVLARSARNDPAGRDALRGKLGAADQWVVVAAIEGLTGPGDPAEIDALRAAVTKPDPLWRWAHRAAAHRLADIGGPVAGAALDRRFLNPAEPPWRDDRDWLHRHRAKIVGILIDRLADPPWWYEAPHALGLLRATEAVGPICDALGRTASGMTHIDALGRIGSADAVPALRDQLRHPHRDVRDHALRALARIGDPRVVDAAVEACDDADPVVRDRAARILARHGDERAVVALIRLCDTAHAAAAAERLAYLGDRRAAPALWHLFRTAPDRRTRHAAGRGLARMDVTREPVPTADVRVRRAVIWLLGHQPGWPARHELVAATGDGDPIVRARAAEAIGRRGGDGLADRLRALRDDPDPRVRVCARIAAGRLTEQPDRRGP